MAVLGLEEEIHSIYCLGFIK